MSENEKHEAEPLPNHRLRSANALLDTLPDTEEIISLPEYASDCPYENCIEASIRYRSAENEAERVKAASRTFCYLTIASNRNGSPEKRPKLFDLHLFNTAHASLQCEQPDLQLATQCLDSIEDEDLREKAEELMPQVESPQLEQKAGFLAIAGAFLARRIIPAKPNP